MIVIRQGDAREELAKLDAGSVDCVVTSPPYFGLRDYGIDGQIGLEPSPDEYVAALVAVFGEVRRVLRPSGTVWLNLGDSYAGSAAAGQWREGAFAADGGVAGGRNRNGVPRTNGLKPKDLIGIPWLVAFALRADGWWLRQDIIWSKPNPMPESVTDRCTKAHEYIFLLSKSAGYHYDAAAIAEPVAATSVSRLAQDVAAQIGSVRAHAGGKTNGNMRAVGGMESRNKRSVWEIATAPYGEAHFATFPPALIEPCILAGCPKGGLVLDPFGGAGTVGLVADRLQRNALLIELNPAYCAMARRRVIDDAPLFVEAAE